MSNDADDAKRVAGLNQRIRAYADKQAVYARARDDVLRLMVPMQPAQQETIAKIGDMLDELDGFFIELGHVDEAGLFDLESYRYMRTVRRIADKKIRCLDEVPEALRTRFDDAFDDDSDTEDGRWIDGEIHRETDVVEEAAGDCRDELQAYLRPAAGLNSRDGFEAYLAGVDAVPVALDQFIDHLNRIWFDYKDAAAAVADHF